MLRPRCRVSPGHRTAGTPPTGFAKKSVEDPIVRDLSVSLHRAVPSDTLRMVYVIHLSHGCTHSIPGSDTRIGSILRGRCVLHAF